MTAPVNRFEAYCAKRPGLFTVASIVITAIAVLLMLPPLVERYETAAITEKVNEALKEPVNTLTSKVDHANGDVQELKGKLDGIDEILKVLLSERIARWSKLTPAETAKQAPQIAATLRAARSVGFFADTVIVNEIAKRFASLVSGPNPPEDVLKALSNVIDYKSFLNQRKFDLPTPEETTKGSGHTFIVKISAGSAPAELKSAGRVVPKGKEAVAEPIGRDLNPNFTTGREFLIVRGASIPIDGMHFRNVIFYGSKILYQGGPIQLENVKWINCEFAVAPNDAGRKLVAHILADNSATYTSTPELPK